MRLKLWLACVFCLFISEAGGRRQVLYPYGIKAGDTERVPRDDENIKVQVNVNINYLNNSYSTFWISANGVLAMSEQCYFWPQNSAYSRCPNTMSVFWSDNDFTKSGKLYYRTTRDASLLQKTRSSLKRKFCAAGFNPSELLIVTWSKVDGYRGDKSYQAEYGYCLENEDTDSYEFCLCQNQYYYDYYGADYCNCVLDRNHVAVCRCINYIAMYGTGVNSDCDCVLEYKNNDYCTCLSNGFLNCGCYLDGTEICQCQAESGTLTRRCACFLETGNREYCECIIKYDGASYLRSCQCYLNATTMAHPFCQCAGCHCEQKILELRCSCPHRLNDECKCLLEGADVDGEYCSCLAETVGQSDYCRCMVDGKDNCECLNPSLATCECYSSNITDPDICNCLIKTEGDLEYCLCFAEHANEVYCECVARYGEDGCECFLKRTSCLNTYQAVVATDGTNTYVMYNYGMIGWTKVETHGPHAVIGFFSGRGDLGLYYHDLSGSSDVENVMYGSNVNQKGRWVYKVDSNVQKPGRC